MQLFDVNIIFYPGGVTVFCAAAGSVSGGLLVKRMEMKVPGIIKLAITISSLSLLFTGMLFIQCDQPEFAGINADYKGGTNFNS